MDWPVFLLLGLSFSNAPEHDYSYSYTASYGVRAEASGTAFYQPVRRVVETEFGLLFGDHTSVVIGYTSAFEAPKLTRAASLSLSVDHRIALDDGWSVTLSLSGHYEGPITHRPCTDAIGRQFHCYHGVTPSSPLYSYDFNTTAAALSQRDIGIDRVGVFFEYVF